MHDLILWAGFAGAWLLVLGPLHQARVELAEEEVERERFESVVDEIGPPRRVSSWWWLVPPVGMALGCVAYTVLEAAREVGVAKKRTELRPADPQ